jgi:hypothetical protein
MKMKGWIKESRDQGKSEPFHSYVFVAKQIDDKDKLLYFMWGWRPDGRK